MSRIAFPGRSRARGEQAWEQAVKLEVVFSWLMRRHCPHTVTLAKAGAQVVIYASTIQVYAE